MSWNFSSEYLELPNVKINNLCSPDASFKYRNITSDVLKKNVTHNHASHNARGHCSIPLFHVVTSLMGGRYTRYRDLPLALLWSLPFDRHLRVTYAMSTTTELRATRTSRGDWPTSGHGAQGAELRRGRSEAAGSQLILCRRHASLYHLAEFSGGNLALRVNDKCP